eukprot:gene18582-18867_t
MKILMAGAIVAGLLATSPAMAQMESREGIALQNQILELRRDMQNLRVNPGSGGGSTCLGGGRPVSGGGGEITAQLLDRVDRLEDAMRRLNGRLDEMDNARQRQGAELAKQIGDLQFRLDNGGAAAPARPSGPPPTTTGPAPTTLGTLPAGAAAAAAAPTGPVRRTPELALQEGNAALARRDYVQAEASAREVIAAGKTNPRAYDAQFLLAQAMTGQKNYPQAAVAFGDTYDRSKQGAHAQDSLVGLAASLAAINEKRSACAALDTLKAQFPTPRADIAARAATLRTSAACR